MRSWRLLRREILALDHPSIVRIKSFCSSYDLNFDVVAAAVVEVKEESALLIWHINQGVEGMTKGNYGANETFS
uniref:Uncharacterized protein n=1 Tax=Tanacetum cinerariifolium TaxID=118510 RepID=A0A6L2N1B8_TANCI|nr:hypothetical protein [Tanacetum cinerariifolium]